MTGEDRHRLTAGQLAEISARTLAHYDRQARAFDVGTRDHDVSQNYAAFLGAIEGAPPFTILDFGCGPGRDLAYFRSLGHEVVGLDGAANFVELARRTGCEVLHQDFLQLSLPVERFDGVFANASLFHVPTVELARVLHVLHRALRPRGVLFSSNPRGPDTEGFSGERYGAFHSLETWRGHLTAAGFEELSHYYRPAGRPRAEQPWLATVWRRGDDLARGIAAYEAGEYWNAHEAWEHIWRVETDPARKTQLQGLIQIAAAWHKVLVMNDPVAASRILRRALEKLSNRRESGESIVSDAFVAAAQRCLGALENGSFDASLLPRFAPS
jgi:SAM-dependent methyltransferase